MVLYWANCDWNGDSVTMMTSDHWMTNVRFEQWRIYGGNLPYAFLRSNLHNFVSGNNHKIMYQLTKRFQPPEDFVRQTGQTPWPLPQILNTPLVPKSCKLASKDLIRRKDGWLVGYLPVRHRYSICCWRQPMSRQTLEVINHSMDTGDSVQRTGSMASSRYINAGSQSVSLT